MSKTQTYLPSELSYAQLSLKILDKILDFTEDSSSERVFLVDLYYRLENDKEYNDTQRNIRSVNGGQNALILEHIYWEQDNISKDEIRNRAKYIRANLQQIVEKYDALNY